MGSFITAIIFLLIAIVTVFAWKPARVWKDRSSYNNSATKTSPLPYVKKAIVALFATLGILIIGLSSFTFTKANEIQIVTNAGANPRAITTGGFHYTNPWTNVDTFSTRLQLFDCDNAALKFNDLSTAHVNVDVGWKIDGEEAIGLWRITKNFKDVQRRMVQPACYSSVNKVLNEYAAEDGVAGANQGVIETKIKNEMNSRLTSKYGIHVDSIVLGGFALSKEVQDRLTKVAAVKTEAKILAGQAENIAQANTNAKNRKQALTPEEFARRCQDLTEQMVETKYPMGTSWNCNGDGVPVTATK